MCVGNRKSGEDKDFFTVGILFVKCKSSREGYKISEFILLRFSYKQNILLDMKGEEV